MGGHSQWGALEPVLAVSGVVTSPSWGLQRPSSLSGGGWGVGCVPRANGFLLFLGFAACKVGRPAPTSQEHKGAGECEVIIGFSVRVQSIV